MNNEEKNNKRNNKEDDSNYKESFDKQKIEDRKGNIPCAIKKLIEDYKSIKTKLA